MSTLKKLASLTLLLILIPVLLVTVVTPPLIGLLLRPPLLQSLERAQALNIEIESVRSGWFSSDVQFSMASSIFSADGLSPVQQSAILHLNHGPIMWHLYDSMFALADIRLLPSPDQNEANFSGSGLLRLNTQGYLEFDAITGFTAFAGDHWLETRASWPAHASWQGWQAVLRALQMTLSIDANATALLQSPAADALVVYQQQGWAHIANGRARSTIRVQNEVLDINGTEMPMSLFLDSR
ncbi:MAG: hypothetical protein WD071_10035 [Pseudohongiella sp.]|uniref:hypothetical protein n=1 Tax=Pseudohongiella sp. TaxID=1979412 RepID=UPI0034A03927